MATYHRPNLTAEERDRLTGLLEAALQSTAGITDPQFEPLYSLFLKVRDARPVSTAKKPG